MTSSADDELYYENKIAKMKGEMKNVRRILGKVQAKLGETTTMLDCARSTAKSYSRAMSEAQERADATIERAEKAEVTIFELKADNHDALKMIKVLRAKLNRMRGAAVDYDRRAEAHRVAYNAFAKNTNGRRLAFEDARDQLIAVARAIVFDGEDKCDT